MHKISRFFSILFFVFLVQLVKPNRNETPVDQVLKTTPAKGSFTSFFYWWFYFSSPERRRLRDAQQRLEELLHPQDELEKRQSVILEKLMEEHKRFKEEAEREAERERLAYEYQKGQGKKEY
ncbi:unnamed protein product [Bursaphelenchus okinawaensis]|uniref:Uncharacterized protein n=1 Tax=Bursaphelenchus okinawaensis TaxID=465554 RepID=A0A811KUH7_9BILA|nr:unnamed protein product [Bursaphelenchus okinawaensis]CAG9113458.1 unnamed protein product [Bursaphelenchus okinawaensis]